jgi:hypothetical protein
MLGHEISAIYQFFRDVEEMPLPFGDPVAFSFEHFMNWIENLKLTFYKNTDKTLN